MKEPFSNMYKLSLTLDFLNQEIAELKSRIKPQDCGHLKTAVSVLSERLEEVREQIHQLHAKESQ